MRVLKNSPIIKTKNVSADDYVKMAKAYFATAKILTSKRNLKKIKNPFPLYYLLSHSLELYLKGYLYKKTQSDKNIKNHKLIEIYDKCKDKGLRLTTEEIAHIEIFNHYNNIGKTQNYLLRYPGIEESALPNLTVSISLIQHISNQL